MNEYLGQILYIKPNYVVSVPEFDRPKNYYSTARLENNKNLSRNKHNNKLSDKAVKRVKSAINWLVASAKNKRVYNASTKKHYLFKVNLITLTLPDTEKPITEKEFKSKLMHPFFVYMKKYYKLSNYVWKIEFQDNGKLHVHITTDCFISHHIIRASWNRLLKSNNFLIDFEKKFKHDNPNSIDVHAVWKVKNLGAYLAKYLSKNEQNNHELSGRIWGCNYELSDSHKCVLGISADELREELSQLNDSRIEYKCIETQDELTGKVFRQAELYFMNEFIWLNVIKGKLRQAYDKHRFQIRQGFDVRALNNSLINC